MSAPSPIPKLPPGVLLGGAVVVVAVSGYFMGLQQTHSTISMTRPAESVRVDTKRNLIGAGKSSPAVRYLDQDWSAHGPNAGWRTTLEGYPIPAPVQPSNAPASPGIRLGALRERLDRRAFDGAPPVIPHSVSPDSTAACLACHLHGLEVRDRIAPKMSHPPFGGACTQCHVRQNSDFEGEFSEGYRDPLSGSSFEGRMRPGRGTRAWPGAPPGIPHATWTKSDCLSCHGPLGSSALRTQHPDRVACTQCHVADAALEQNLNPNNSHPPLGLSR